MHTTRLASALAITSILLAACGGGSAATQQPPGATTSTGGGGGSATEVPADTQAAEATSGGGGGGGGGSADVEAVANQLVPPNSTEISKTTAQDTWFVIYESTDSVDSLKNFYADAIVRAGQKIFSTTTIQGGVSYVFAKDDSGGFGGSVNIYPSGDGKTAVQVTVAKT
ncbi:MAG TPA: hypothetical protein VL749_08930 [Patescibacteria group bacterium]|jgi:hypothetical protein|nr:hypothetical protein [Patescibacteria group bacterium]